MVVVVLAVDPGDLKKKKKATSLTWVGGGRHARTNGDAAVKTASKQ